MWANQKAYRVIGAVMAKARDKAGVTQQALAKKLGKPQSFVSAYETGQRRLDLAEFLLIAEMLDIDADRLFRTIIKNLDT